MSYNNSIFGRSHDPFNDPFFRQGSRRNDPFNDPFFRQGSRRNDPFNDPFFRRADETMDKMRRESEEWHRSVRERWAAEDRERRKSDPILSTIDAVVDGIGKTLNNGVGAVKSKTYQLYRKAYDKTLAPTPRENYIADLREAINEGDEKLTAHILSQFSLSDRQALRIDENMTNLFVTVLKKSPNVDLIQVLFKMHIQTMTLKQMYENCTVKKTKESLEEEAKVAKAIDSSLEADEDSSWLDLAKDATLSEVSGKETAAAAPDLVALEDYKLRAFRQYFEGRLVEKLNKIDATIQSITLISADLNSLIIGYMMDPKSDDEIEEAIKERNNRIQCRIVIDNNSFWITRKARSITQTVTGSLEV